ncbi:hypothetical protein ABIC63_003417 [Pseudacidovorax sp. 1753]
MKVKDKANNEWLPALSLPGKKKRLLIATRFV